MQCIDCIPSLFQADCSINSKLLIPNSDGICRPCKYCTKSKNLLQNKNDYRVFESRFLWFMLRF